MRFWKRRALVCQEAVALMTDYLEDVLPPRDRARLETHLSGCPHCGEYLAQIRVMIETLGRVELGDLPDDALEELVVLYRRWRSDV